MFTAQTDTRWSNFFEMALEHLEHHNGNIRLGYRISGEMRAMMYLVCKYDWTLALHRMREKIHVSRTRAVIIELQNMVSKFENERAISYLLAFWQAQLTRKGGKGGHGHGNKGGQRTRGDDIPPKASPDTKHQYQCLLTLQRFLFCNEHSEGGKRTFCYIEQASQRSPGGHREVDHSGMTLWAKHMVSTFDYTDA